MKHLIISAILSLAPCLGHSQNVAGSYHYRIGDKVKKQHVENMPLASTGRHTLWDFSEMELSGKSHRVKYSPADINGLDSLIAGTEHRTRSYYRCTQDSLLLCGYEDNLNRVSYDRPELLLHLPLRYGDRSEGVFHGTATYCEKMFMRVCGSYTVETDGTGSMVLPSGDTLRHVSRVHLRELALQQYYPHIMTERELQTYVDSIAPYTADSIVQRLSADSLTTVTDTYRWYAAGYRYPILEYMTTGWQGEAPGETTILYCSPEEQKLYSDEENEQVRECLAQADRQGGNDNNAVPSPSALSRCEVSVHGQMVRVSFDLSKDAMVTGLVCTVSGMVQRQQSQRFAAGADNQMGLDCSGLRKGEYVLYLNVNGTVQSYAVSL